MSAVTIHAPTGEVLGDPLTIAGNADKYAENVAAVRPGFVVIIWDADGEYPLRSWSFPTKEVAA